VQTTDKHVTEFKGNDSNKYECTMDQELQTVLLAGSWQTLLHVGEMLRVHSPNSSTFLHEIMSWPPSWKYDIITEIWRYQSMHIYLKNIRGPNFIPIRFKTTQP